MTDDQTTSPSNVVAFRPPTGDDPDRVTPEMIVADVTNKEWTKIIVIGETKKGTQYHAVSEMNAETALWFLQWAQKGLV